MFRIEDNVPDVYVQESRDFQLLSRLYDLVFQCTRFSIDSMKYASDTMQCNSSLLNSLSTKLGFFSNLNITDKEYRIILSAFPHMIRHKGTTYGLKLLANVFSKLSNSELSINYTYETLDGLTSTKVDPTIDVLVNITKQESSVNFELLQELLEYIRPAGCRISFSPTTSLPHKMPVMSLDLSATSTKHPAIPATEVTDTNVSGVVSNTRQEQKGYTEANTIGFTQVGTIDQTHTINTEEGESVT